MTEYITFSDLEFHSHPNLSFGFRTQAEVAFANGYGASVVTGPSAYVDPEHPFELAVLKNGYLCHTTPITDGVVGHQDADGVTDLLRQIQDLE